MSFPDEAWSTGVPWAPLATDATFDNRKSAEQFALVTCSRFYDALCRLIMRIDHRYA